MEGDVGIESAVRCQNQTQNQREFKINNNHTPYFARHFMWMYPEYKGFFEVRDTVNDELKRAYWKWVRTDGIEVFEIFRDKALQLIARGIKHYSADAIIHVVRFEMDVNRKVISHKS